MASQEAAAKCEGERYAQMRLHKLRHLTLARLHPDGVVAVLLAQHAPHEVDWGAGTYLQCRGCPAFYDSQAGEDLNHEWPCPTWQTISDATT